MSLAARLTDLDIEYIDGVRMDDAARRFLPPTPEGFSLSNGAIGAYRAHMNVLRKIIEENITSALVLEGDVDWDIRIKSQMHSFAKASRMLLEPGQENRNWSISENLPSGQSTGSTPSSPFGDVGKWDLSWLGHCGAHFPPENNDAGVALGRVEIPGDITVPEEQHLEVQFGGEAIHQYPNHTRVVSRAWGNVCSLAYGITQRGAQKFLYELAVRKLNDPADLMFRSMCGGNGGPESPYWRPTHTCLTVQPPLFEHHRPAASKSTFSEIGDHGEHFNDVAFTRNIRWSTRVNFAKLVNGETDFIDQLKDGEPFKDFESESDED